MLMGAVLLLALTGWLAFSRGAETPEENPSSQTSAASEESLPARPLPDLILEDYQGVPVSFANLKGKPLVVNAWAAWCPFCLKELTDFALAQQEFADRVTIIAVDRAESRDVAKNYTDKLGVTQALTFLLDPQDSFYKTIGGFSMPETIFVDKDGFIREHKRGPMELNEIRERIQRLFVLKQVN